MASFRYRAYRIDGRLSEGTIDAASPDAASETLWAQGLTPFQMRAVDAATKPWWQRDISFGGGSARTDLASFTREFATLNAADIPLDDALRILADQATSPRMREIATGLLADILNGATLS